MQSDDDNDGNDQSSYYESSGDDDDLISLTYHSDDKYSDVSIISIVNNFFLFDYSTNSYAKWYFL